MNSRALSGRKASTSSSSRCLGDPCWARQVSCKRSERRSVSCRASGSTLTLFSPSKINVFLRVIRKRDDGYHDLASLFHVIDLGDDMGFEVLEGSQKDELTCSMPGLPTDSSNLVIKALELFRSKTGCSNYFKVDLVKQVPAGAGLGGGSGNAATTLWAANELSGRPANNKELLQWAGDIGSDISVFFSEGAAFCTGRGEIVENLPPPLPLSTPLLLVKPPIGCSTPAIFKALRLEERSTADPRALLTRLAQEQRMLPELCVNDLEQPAFDTLAELKALKQRLEEESSGRFSTVFMTGSGSTLVCVGSHEKPRFLEEVQYADTFVHPARLIARQPGQWYSRAAELSSTAI